jgi:hypothetical protein
MFNFDFNLRIAGRDKWRRAFKYHSTGFEVACGNWHGAMPSWGMK